MAATRAAVAQATRHAAPESHHQGTKIEAVHRNCRRSKGVVVSRASGSHHPRTGPAASPPHSEGVGKIALVLPAPVRGERIDA
jgi:hypothetical protein